MTGQCIHALTGHTSLVGLLRSCPSYLVSAAADATVRVWDPNSGELKYLGIHTDAITCLYHDEYKVLSGSDGALKMWNIREGAFIKDLLTDRNGVWQVVAKGRWCVAASSKNDSTVIDVWEFGREEGDNEWDSEDDGSLYDEGSENEAEDIDQADSDAIGVDLQVV